MENNAITSANAVMQLTAVGLFPSPVKIEGYSTDNMWTVDAVDAGEFQMGPDGRLSVGWVANPRMMSVSLQANSPAIDFFDTVAQYEQQRQEKIQLNGTVIIPALKRKFALINGFLRNYQPMPGAARVLQPRPFGLLWQSITWARTN